MHLLVLLVCKLPDLDEVYFTAYEKSPCRAHRLLYKNTALILDSSVNCIHHSKRQNQTKSEKKIKYFKYESFDISTWQKALLYQVQLSFFSATRNILPSPPKILHLMDKKKAFKTKQKQLWFSFLLSPGNSSSFLGAPELLPITQSYLFFSLVAAKAKALPLSAGMKAAVKDCSSDPSVLCLDMLWIQRTAGLSLTFPSSCFVHRSWRVFSRRSGSWPGGGGREREKEGEKTKQNRFIGSAEAVQTHWGIVSPQRNQLLRAGNHQAPTASQD